MATDTPIPTVTATATTTGPTCAVIPLTVAVGEVVEVFGTGQVGSQVEILAGGVVVGVAQVEPDGEWRFDLTFSAPGVQYIGCRARGDGGLSLTVTIAAYVIITPALATPSPTPTLAPVAVETPGGMVNAGGDQSVVVQGQAAPYATIEITFDNGMVFTTVADGRGSWQRDVSLPGYGVHRVFVRAVDALGRMSEVQITIVAATPTAVPARTPASTITPRGPVDAVLPMTGAGQANEVAAVVLSVAGVVCALAGWTLIERRNAPRA